jgi:hypothetical protein
VRVQGEQQHMTVKKGDPTRASVFDHCRPSLLWFEGKRRVIAILDRIAEVGVCRSGDRSRRKTITNSDDVEQHEEFVHHGLSEEHG